MSFDKTKAMRNTERLLSQGKIRAAISEYQLAENVNFRDVGKRLQNLQQAE